MAALRARAAARRQLRADLRRGAQPARAASGRGATTPTTQRFQIVGDAIGGIKDVKVLGLEASYLAPLPAGRRREIAEADALNAVIGEVPRYVLEAVAFGGMLLFVLFLLVTGDGSLGGDRADARRSTPSPASGCSRRCSRSTAPSPRCASRSPTLDKLHEDMTRDRPRRCAGARGRGAARAGAAPRPRRSSSTDVHYAYPAAERPALAGVDMTIPARSHRRHRRRHRRRQDHARRHHARPARPRAGRAPGRRDAGRRRQPARLAEQHRLRAAADLPDRRHGRAPTSPSGSPEDVDQAAVERAARIAELHDFVMTRAARGLRHPGRRARRAALRRPAPAHRHRPRALPRPRRADPRRGDQRARQPDRAGGDGRGAQPRPRQDHRS